MIDFDIYNIATESFDESSNDSIDSLEEYILALEDFIDDVIDDAWLESALESEGSGMETDSLDELLSRASDLKEKAMTAKSESDKQAFIREYESVMKQIRLENKKSDNDKKKRIKKILKIVGGSVLIIAATFGLVKLGKKISKDVKHKHAEEILKKRILDKLKTAKPEEKQKLKEELHDLQTASTQESPTQEIVEKLEDEIRTDTVKNEEVIITAEDVIKAIKRSGHTKPENPKRMKVKGRLTVEESPGKHPGLKYELIKNKRDKEFESVMKTHGIVHEWIKGDDSTKLGFDEGSRMLDKFAQLQDEKISEIHKKRPDYLTMINDYKHGKSVKKLVSAKK